VNLKRDSRTSKDTQEPQKTLVNLKRDSRTIKTSKDLDHGLKDTKLAVEKPNIPRISFKLAIIFEFQ